MSPNTFHLFSELPCELRLQIWESAIKKRTTHIYDYSTWNWDSVGLESLMPQAQKKQSYGINYVRFVNTGDFIPLDCSWNKPRPTNRSAYLWHAGLWMACKESHEVMRKYWLNDSFYKENPDYWPLALFKLPFDRSESNIHEYAVEFDPAWTSELAGLEKYRPTDRLSPTLAFAIRIFCEIATQEMILPRFIHLIDKYSGWKSVSNAEKHSVYYDCEYEYIRIDPSDSLATNRLVRHTPMLRFLDQVDRLLKHRLTWKRKTSPRGWGHYGLPPDGLSVRKLVRVMARRDKEVVLKITRGNAMQPRMKKAASVTSSHESTVEGKASCTMEVVV
ncbi:uncharacterized protein FFB14_07097 [Fusarium fujikuroi]|nr:uncharacterized protein FFB14_07097 [Fusarium fujikuroi]